MSSGQLKVNLTQSTSKQEALAQVSISVGFAVLTIILLLWIAILLGLEFEFSDAFEHGFLELLNFRSFAAILFWGAPLVLTALSVAVAFKAGLFNIGGQGQFMIGGCFGAIWAAHIIPDILSFLSTEFSFIYPIADFIFNLPFVMITLTIICGALAGAIWGGIPGYLKAKHDAHEVITTILMNLIALTFITYLVGSQSYSPFVDKSSLDANSQTAQVIPSARFSAIVPEISSSLNWSIVIVILLGIATYFIIFRSKFGFQLRAVGLNRSSAEAAGINSQRIIIMAMLLSGALAGIGGTLFVLGSFPYRYKVGITGTRGFDGIVVSLLGFNNPLIILVVAIFFGFLQQSSINIDLRSSIPPEIIFALQALIVLFISTPVIAKTVYNFIKKRQFPGVRGKLEASSSKSKTLLETPASKIQDPDPPPLERSFETDVIHQEEEVDTTEETK